MVKPFDLQGKVDRQFESSRARFFVGVSLDVFTGWKLFLVESARDARLLVKHVSDASTREYSLLRGEFDDVLGSAFHALETLSAEYPEYPEPDQ